MTRASDLARLLGAGATINDGTTITTDDNTNTHETTGTTATDGDVTTAYADLKESDVIKWVKDDLGSTKVSELEAEATSGVIQNLGVPW